MPHPFFLYLGVLAGIFFEGELVLLAAVLAAHHGYLDLEWVVTMAVLAPLASDSIYFYLGRHKARGWMGRGNWGHRFNALAEKLETNRLPFLLGYRFIYGLRWGTPLVLGATKIAYIRFMGFSMVTTLVWVFLYTALGLWASGFLQRNLGHLAGLERWVMGMLLVGFLFFIGVHYGKKASKDGRERED
ncbi:DedA family protein [Flagellimonas beolgyonensis]|uniref:DedA family protein n=1 Tax=Flagellimonas beolgyonensis TaxID=864064 RepID=UPI003D65F695